MNLHDRFCTLAARLGLFDHETIWQQMTSAYTESHRAYHTLTHIADGLKLCDTFSHILPTPDLLAYAWWFHDLVYDPHRHDNERNSANIALSYLRNPTVERLILATCHKQTPVHPDEQWLVDIDLSILGASTHAFDAYERRIRQEYSFLADASYRKGRRFVLESFQNRDRLFLTEPLYNKFETTARANLARSIARLRRST